MADAMMRRGGDYNEYWSCIIYYLLVFIYCLDYIRMLEEVIMEDVIMIAVVVFIIFFVIFTYFVSMSGYTTKRKNPDDYKEINRKQREKDIEQVQEQDKYDNEWGYIK